MNNGAAGFPDGLSDCSACVGDQCGGCTKSMPKATAFKPDSCGYDTGDGGNWKEGEFTRVHRDQDIVNAMRGWMGLSQHEDPTMLGLSPNCATKKAEELIQ